MRASRDPAGKKRYTAQRDQEILLNLLDGAAMSQKRWCGAPRKCRHGLQEVLRIRLIIVSGHKIKTPGDCHRVSVVHDIIAR